MNTIGRPHSTQDLPGLFDRDDESEGGEGSPPVG